MLFFKLYLLHSPSNTQMFGMCNSRFRTFQTYFVRSQITSLINAFLFDDNGKTIFVLTYKKHISKAISWNKDWAHFASKKRNKIEKTCSTNNRSLNIKPIAGLMLHSCRKGHILINNEHPTLLFAVPLTIFMSIQIPKIAL